MTRMTGPDCAVMLNLINTQTHRHRHTPQDRSRVEDEALSFRTRDHICRHEVALTGS